MRTMLVKVLDVLRILSSYARKGYDAVCTFEVSKYVGRDQYETVGNAVPTLLIAHGLSTTIVLITFWDEGLEVVPWTLFSYFICLLVTREWLSEDSKFEGGTKQNRLSDLSRTVLFGLSLASPWALLPFLYVDPVPNQKEIILFSVTAGAAVTGGMLIAPVMPAALVYVVVSLIPLGLGFLGSAESGLFLLGCFVLLFAVFSVFMVVTTSLHSIRSSRMTVALRHSVSDMQAAQSQLQFIAKNDLLTGLLNRRAFMDDLNHVASKSAAGGCCAVIFLDLDGFKLVNDTYGHDCGDELLKLVAGRLEKSAGGQNTAYRLGGDEFVILCHNLKDPHQSEMIASQYVESVSEPYIINGFQICIGASAGIAVSLDDDVSADNLIKRADLAMYEAKSAGRGMVVAYSDALVDTQDENASLGRALTKALANNEFTLKYHTIFEIGSSRAVCYEALLRWKTPEFGKTMLPNEFLPVADRLGLMHEIGDWVLLEAIKTIVQLPDHPNLAVNVSATQIERQDFAERTLNIVRASGFQPSRLELEVNDRAVLKNNKSTLENINRLRASGVSITMDDFGSGYASVRQLLQFPFDKIKIDRVFVDSIERSKLSREIVTGILRIASGLSLKVIAKGIETERQCLLLQEMGCTQVQGFLFGEPVFKEALLKHLKQGSGRMSRAKVPVPPLNEVSSICCKKLNNQTPTLRKGDNHEYDASASSNLLKFSSQ